MTNPKDRTPTVWTLGVSPRPVTKERALAYASVGAGWAPIIETLIDVIEAACSVATISQVKEKYGGLRFYWHGALRPEEETKGWVTINPSEAVDFAEKLSYYVCQNCGRPGTLRTEGWHEVRCEECYDGDV